MFSFRLFLESTTDYHLLIQISCASSGWHGEEDIPAGDAKKGHVYWHYLPGYTNDEDIYPTKLEGIVNQILQGAEVVLMENPSTGSYHERFQNLYVYVKLSEQ